MPDIRILVDGQPALTITQAATHRGITPAGMRALLGRHLQPAAHLDGRTPLYLTAHLNQLPTPRQEPAMTTTTSYGTWCTRVDDMTLTVAQHIADALGDYTDDYNLDSLAAAYRAAINDALPPDVTLAGVEFIGPYHAADCDWAGYPVTDDGTLDISAIVASVDFWALAAQHEKTTEEQQ